LGSQARGEQLLRSDQDSALIFEIFESSNVEFIRKNYVNLAKDVTKILNECGFDYCPAKVMASNSHWCLSLNEWKKQFSRWIYTPGSKELMYSTIFYDFNPIYGDSTLADELTDHIFSEINNHEIFLAFLARNALENPPPLSFFRNFMVEHNGEHKNEFDIKGRTMMPLVDGARVLALSSQIKKERNTIKRFKNLSELEPENKDLYDQLADGYATAMRFRALQGLKHNNDGRYFNPTELNKLQRLSLRNCFGPIKDLQTLLSVRFNLKMFG
ncbi:MAG: putative nucleotidyltransferase substrate binding domain-containing protein, partial [Melioribacteraceae bacterium]|nr:putative nucleotidyltransferase substrate binding domain-containing protein [Melioribacteraceae bacterium]